MQNAFGLDDEPNYGSGSTQLSFPVLQGQDLQQVAQVRHSCRPRAACRPFQGCTTWFIPLTKQTIVQLFDPVTSSRPDLAKALQQQVQSIQSSTEAWGLIAGLANHEASLPNAASRTTSTRAYCLLEGSSRP